MKNPTILVVVVLLFCFGADVVVDGDVLISSSTDHSNGRVGAGIADLQLAIGRELLFLVDTPEAVLNYHNGPVLSGGSDLKDGSVIPVYLIWYGDFDEGQKLIIRDFFASFPPTYDDLGSDNGQNAVDLGITDVAKWWSTTRGFRDASGAAVAESIDLEGELDDNAYSLGKRLTDVDILSIVLTSLAMFPPSNSPDALYMVLTAADVSVDGFCRNSCASHFATGPSTVTRGLQVPYAWVGNAKYQCPGECAWPFARPSYVKKPVAGTLIRWSEEYSWPVFPAPNGEIGVDGMVVQIAYMLAGAATNPFNNAYYQGDASMPLEVGTACFGFGTDPFPGFPGRGLRKDPITGARFNAEGVNSRKFLLPTLWNPTFHKCTPFVSSPGISYS